MADEKLIDSYFFPSEQLAERWICVCKACGSIVDDNYRSFHAQTHMLAREKPRIR